MSKIKLPSNVALRLEALRAAGVTDSETTECLRKGDIASFHSPVFPDMTFDSLLDYERQHPGNLAQALTRGYEYTFITIGGLQSLLRVRVSLQAEGDYERGSHYLDRVPLNTSEIAYLRSVLPRYWVIVEEQEQSESERRIVKIEHRYTA